MNEILTVVAYVAALLALLLGFRALDNWHTRKAWRDADREARVYFKQRYGRDYPG